VLAPAPLWLHNGSANESAQPGVTEVPILPEGVLSGCHAGDVIRSEVCSICRCGLSSRVRMRSMGHADVRRSANASGT
jgi:hypothetical protein